MSTELQGTRILPVSYIKSTFVATVSICSKNSLEQAGTDCKSMHHVQSMMLCQCKSAQTSVARCTCHQPCAQVMATARCEPLRQYISKGLTSVDSRHD